MLARALLIFLVFGIAATARADEAAPPARIGDARTDPRNPIVGLFKGKRLDLWSLQPVTRPAVPAVQRNDWPLNDIDRFVLAKLEAVHHSPSAQADKRTLIRRLSYDLIGLPPTPQQVEAFVADPSPQAYDALVDRLLASPDYGRHWARMWLDVVRYSDSNGFDWDEFRPQAWRFRDYVIRSFNADKPFDQFIREQLAGDELLSGPPTTPAEQDELIATGYLRLGPFDNSAPAFKEEERSHAELLADLTETTGSAFLGLTMSCCRCHDHKYDPISQADHYRMRAFFASVKFADDLPVDLAPRQQEIRSHNERVDAGVKQIDERRDQVLAPVRDRLRREKIAKLSAEDQAALKQPDPQAKAKTDALEEKIKVSDDEVNKALSEDEKKQLAAIDNEKKTAEQQRHPFTTALLMTDKEGDPPVTRVLGIGDYRQERQPVEPGFLSYLDPNPAQVDKAPNPHSTGRRLALANWIASPKNPLTARVLVNRLWQGHFGRGILANGNDFGFASGKPGQADLLDYLASELVDGGWSIKKIHRLIVTSAAYQQASTIAGPEGELARTDPDNELLWRQNLRRLSAEQVRDSLLSISGLLLEHDGGPPIWPELPPEVMQANPALLDDNSEKTKGWYPSNEKDRNVRTIYLVQKRTVKLPFLETFDLPDNAVSCPRRNASTVAPQSLAMMNGSDALAASTALANRVKAEAGDDPKSQVRRVYALVFNRAPQADESDACTQFLGNRTLTELCRALLNTNEFLYVD